VGNKLEIKEGRKDTFIVYLEDDDSKKEVWVHLLGVKDGFVTFLTQSKDHHTRNKVSIPIARVLKIKTREGDGDESTTELL